MSARTLRRVFTLTEPELPADTDDRQSALRDRRRARLAVVLDGTFDLAVEVAAIIRPLAARAETAASSRTVRAAIDDVADAVDGLVAAVAHLLAEADAQRRTKALPFEQATSARRALLRLHRRPTAPRIADGALVEGTWADALADHAATVSDPLAALLGRALPPGSTRGALSASERVVEPLRDLDAAADALSRAIDTASMDGAPDLVGDRDRRERGAALAELTHLGVELTEAEQEAAR